MTDTCVITDVRVFDGTQLLEGARSVIVAQSVVAAVSSPDEPMVLPAGSTVVEGSGGTLLPGLVDGHVHLTDAGQLRLLGAAGVTTCLDMGAWPASFVDSLRHLPGLPDIRSAGPPAVAPEGDHTHIPGFPADGIVPDADAGRRFVGARLAEGCDYVKVVLDRPGRPSLDQPTLDVIVEAAHTNGRWVIAHVVAAQGVAMALQAGVDVLTHIPMMEVLDAAVVARAAAQVRAWIPTLTMMEGVIANLRLPSRAVDTARANVAALHRAGVVVLAGTDANSTPGVPAAVPHGESLHHELELLVACGLTPVEALRAATSATARTFGLDDRGVVEPRRRADLVLVDGDPTSDIAATSAVRRAWFAGLALGD